MSVNGRVLWSILRGLDEKYHALVDPESNLVNPM